MRWTFCSATSFCWRDSWPRTSFMPSPPSFETTTKLVARALHVTPAQLLAALRPAGEGDLAAVLLLRQENIGPSIVWDDEAYLTWRYRFGRTGYGFGDLWMAMHEGELLGFIGVEDMVCTHASRRVTCGRVMDILVAPRTKNSGLGIWLSQAMFRQNTFTLSVGANPNSVGTVHRLYALLPQPGMYQHPIDLQRYLEQRFGAGIMTRAAAQLGNLTMRCWRQLSRLTAGNAWTIKAVNRFDKSVEALAAKASIGPNEVVVERSADYLNRRLFDSPRSAYSVWGAYRGGEWLGYIAWRITLRSDSEVWMHVIDLQVDAVQHDAALRALLAFSLRQAELARCNFVGVTLQSGQYTGVLRRHGFLGPKNNVHHIVGLHAADPELLRTLCSGNWTLTDLCADQDGY